MDRQRVHVRADRQRWPRAPALDHADDTGAAKPGAMRDRQTRELGSNDTRSTCFLEGQFGVGVDVAADGDQGGLDGGNRFPEAPPRIVDNHPLQLRAISWRHGR